MLGQEPQRNLKSTLVFNIPTTVVRLLLFVKAERFLQKCIGVDYITSSAQGTVNHLPVDDAEHQDRVSSFSLQQELRGLRYAVAVLATHKSHISIDEGIEHLFL